jgi:hypothetical protein
MVETVHNTGRRGPASFQEAALLAEIDRLRAAIRATEQTLHTQNQRLADLAARLQRLRAAAPAPPAVVGLRETLRRVVEGVTDQIATEVGQIAGPSRPGPAPPRATVSAKPQVAPAPAAPAPVTAAAPQQGEVSGAPAVVEEKAAAAPAAEAAKAAGAAPAAQGQLEAPESVPAETQQEAGEALPGEAEPAVDLAAEESQLVEALETGRRALADLDRCMTLVQELAHAGTWRVVAGLVSSRRPEHAKIDEARRAAREAQELLRVFERQVRRLREPFGERIELVELKDFAEGFAKALLLGSPDQPVGHRAVEAAREAYHDVRRACARLQRESIALRARRAAQERRRRLARGA